MEWVRILRRLCIVQDGFSMLHIYPCKAVPALYSLSNGRALATYFKNPWEEDLVNIMKPSKKVKLLRTYCCYGFKEFQSCWTYLQWKDGWDALLLGETLGEGCGVYVYWTTKEFYIPDEINPVV